MDIEYKNILLTHSALFILGLSLIYKFPIVIIIIIIAEFTGDVCHY